MTTLLSVQNSWGKRARCDAKCHNALKPECACCCGGHYHGKQEGSVGLAVAVQQMQAALLLDLGTKEQGGELWIEGYRDNLTSPYQARPRGKPRIHQDPLPL